MFEYTPTSLSKFISKRLKLVTFTFTSMSHRAGVLSVLSIPDKGPQLEKSAVSDAILSWDSKEFEYECAARGLCVTALRSYTEWDKEDQKKVLENVPHVLLRKVGDAPRRGSVDETEVGKERQ